MSNDHELWLQADQLFERALDLEPADRTALLDRECHDPAVRRLVEALLEAEAHADSPLDRTPLYDPSTEPQPHLAPPRGSGEIDLRGRRLGAFEIVGEIGRGGMAVVYRARRVDGEVEQDVAIKVLARSLASADSRARFRRERQILANSDHPGVARLIDGGETAEGLLYLVMELVDGQRIDEYCDLRRSTIRERIELFREVGRAVADAHRRLVVHRDIKPSNILVSTGGFPKLLDFGIAKLLEDPENATRTGWLLTPAYAAPEQFSGGEITTATDVYQLGLLLYNLLVGVAPYPVDGAPAEIVRHVCRTPPERPVLAAARHATLDEAGLTGPQLAARRISSRRQLKAQLSGDLEAILLKALRKEPELRYRSVEALIDDLERYLEGRPVRARRSSMAYRLRKLADRHRGAVAAGLLAGLALVGWAISSTWQAERFAGERDRANAEAQTARQAAEFLAGLFVGSDPMRGARAGLSAQELLDQGAKRLIEGNITDPRVRSSLAQTIGVVYYRLARYEQAVTLLRIAADGFATTLGPGARETTGARRYLIAAVHLSGRFDEAEMLATELLAETRARNDDPRAVASLLNRLGEIAFTRGHNDRAEQFHRESIAVLESLPDRSGAGSVIGIQDRLARVFVAQGRLAEAQDLFTQVLDTYRASGGPEHPALLVGERRLAALLRHRGQFESARALFLDTLEKQERVLGLEHAITLSTMQELATLERLAGDLERAVTLIEGATTGLTKAVGDDHPMTLEARTEHAQILAALGRRLEAEHTFADTASRLHATLGPHSPYTLANDLAWLRHREAMGATDDLATRYSDVIDRAEQGLGPRHAHTASACYHAARLAIGRSEESLAISLLRRALEGGYRERTLDASVLELAQRPELQPVYLAWRRRAAELESG